MLVFGQFFPFRHLIGDTGMADSGTAGLGDTALKLVSLSDLLMIFFGPHDWLGNMTSSSDEEFKFASSFLGLLFGFFCEASEELSVVLE